MRFNRLRMVDDHATIHVYEDALETLTRIGCRVMDRTARELLLDLGASVKKSDLMAIPAGMKKGDLKYSNKSGFQLVIPFLCHFLASLNCITDSGRRYVKFPRQIHHRHSQFNHSPIAE